MQINVSYDSSVDNAPPEFKSAISYAVNFLDAAYINPVTVNISVGWGEQNGLPLLENVLGQSSSSKFIPFDYTNLAKELHLPNFDVTGKSGFMPIAEAKALGIEPLSASIDGHVGFSDNIFNQFTFDPNNRAVSGKYDFIGVALHEFTEVLGRISVLATQDAYTPFDLFHSPDGYFPADSLHLGKFNTDPGGDFWDWSSDMAPDSFMAFIPSGQELSFSVADDAVMQALGYDTIPDLPLLHLLTPSQTISALYIGYFDRAADTPGHTFWEKSDVSLETISNYFLDQSETTNLGGFISDIYHNLFNRDVDASGLNFWINAGEHGETTLGSLVLDIINGSQGDDIKTILNKIAVSEFFVDHAGTFPAAHDALLGVTSDVQTVGIAEAKIHI